jgi:hypothetical protein
MCELDTNNDVIVEAYWAPLYEINEMLLISDYKIQIQKILKQNSLSICMDWVYIIKVINIDMNIPEIYINEDALGEQDPRLISLIKTLIADKNFEREFTLKTLNAIYKKSK